MNPSATMLPDTGADHFSHNFRKIGKKVRRVYTEGVNSFELKGREIAICQDLGRSREYLVRFGPPHSTRIQMASGGSYAERLPRTMSGRRPVNAHNPSHIGIHLVMLARRYRESFAPN